MVSYTPGERAPGTQWVGGWVGLRAGTQWVGGWVGLRAGTHWVGGWVGLRAGTHWVDGWVGLSWSGRYGEVRIVDPTGTRTTNITCVCEACAFPCCIMISRLSSEEINVP
jgi:hypothetical protein